LFTGMEAARGMDDDWVIAAIDEIDRCRLAVTAAMDDARAVLAQAREERRTGVPVPDVLDNLLERDGRAKRLRVAAAFAAYERQAMEVRAAMVRELVDTEGMTLTAVAQRIEVSRQMAARLYQAASASP
jgi:hypothetical protein